MVSPEVTVIEIPNRDIVCSKRIQKCPCPYCKDGIKLVVGGKRQHICFFKDCYSVYTKRSHLLYHLRSHSGEKPFRCDFSSCKKSFSRSAELARHKKIHTGDKTFQCSECHKSFARSDHFAKHTQMHARKKSLKTEADRKKKNIEDVPVTEDEHQQIVSGNQKRKSVIVSLADAKKGLLSFN